MLTERQLVAVRPMVRAVARGFEYLGDVEDLEQDALLKLWRHRGAFDGTDVEAMHWAGRVTRRTLIDLARRSDREQVMLDRVSVAADLYHRALSTPEDTCYAGEVYRAHIKNLGAVTEWRARARTRELVAA